MAHAGVNALGPIIRQCNRDGLISLQQAIALRAACRRNPDLVASHLEDARLLHVERFAVAAVSDPTKATLESVAAKADSLGDWTPEQWAELIRSILQELIAALPQILALCGA